MMSSALAKRIDSHDLLALFSVETPRALPTLSRCPVCGQESSLEASFGHGHCPVYWCRNPECWFQGDGIQLYRQVTHKSLREACYELVAERVLARDGDLEQEIQDYQLEIQGYYDKVWGIWDRANTQFRAGSSGAAGLLQGFGCWESQASTCGVLGLGRHLGVLKGSEIRELPGVPKHLELTVRSNEHYLVLPLWLDRWMISGFVFFGRDNQQRYWQILGKDAGIGLLHTTGMNETTILGCSQVVNALQALMSGVTSASRVPVQYLHDNTQNWGYLVAQSRVMLNVGRRIPLYRQALAFPECRILTEHDLQGSGLDQIHHPQSRLLHMSSLGHPTYRALAVLLGSQQAHTAAATAQALNLQPQEIQRVLAAAPEHQRGQLEAIFRQGTSTSSAKFQSDTITCSDEGWKSAKKGLISNAMFFVDQIVCDTGTHQGTAIGTVMQAGRSFKFASPMRDLESHTQAWLQNILAENRAGWLEVQPGWASKLFAISRIFKTPATTYTSNAIGWVENGHRLVLPGLVVEAGVVSTNPHPIQGQPCRIGLAKEDSSAAQLEGWVRDDEAGGVFWALFALVASNLLGPFHKHGTFGIGILDRPQGLLSGMVMDMVDQVGLERITFRNTGQAKLQEIWRQEQQSPLPLHIDETWASNEGFVKWIANRQTRNCVVLMTRPVAIGTCLDGGWAYVRSDAPTQESRARYTGAWNLLPRFIAWVQLHPIEWPAIRSGALPTLYAAMAEWLQSLGLEPKVLRRAQGLVEVDMLERTSSWGSKFLSLLIESVESGLLPLRPHDPAAPPSDCLVTDYAEELVFISRATLTRLMAQMGLPVPHHQHIVSMLQASKSLKGTRYRDTAGYAIPMDQWSLYYSLRGTR